MDGIDRWVAVLLAGVVLGAGTRLEELTPGVFVGLGSSAAWLGAAWAAGHFLRRSAVAGAVVLTAANAGYYATDGPYGPVAAWLVVGLLAGLVVGTLGGWCRRGGRAGLAAGAAGAAVVAALEIAGAHVTVAGLHLP